MRALICSLAALALLVPSTSAQSEPVVRVRLLSSNAPAEAHIESLTGALAVESEGRLVGRGSGVRLASSRDGVEVRLAEASATGAQVRVTGERLRLRAGRIDREYTGALTVRADGDRLEIVNATPLAPYVASVVAAELGFDVLEAAKAQAVLARTYALRRLGSDREYDLDDHQGSQVFRGIGTVTGTSQLATDGTAGEVLTYAGDLAEGTYFSSSGGHTADNEIVWRGAPLPYLRGVPDPYDADSPHHRWRTAVPKTQVLDALTPAVGAGATGLVVEARSRSGRVTRMRALGAPRPLLTGAQFRRRVNAVAGWRTIRSTKFELSVRGDEYVLQGGGFGHGVGMSQYGAMGQAQAGRSYRDILTYYFTGARLDGGRALPAPSISVAEPLRPSRDERPSQQPSPAYSRYVQAEIRDLTLRGTQGPTGGSDTSAGDPVREVAPQTRNDRVGERRSGQDRRSGIDRRQQTRPHAGSEQRQDSGRRRSDRRQITDRRQQADTPVHEASDRRGAW
ncbi:MAG: SpoIID/LytB domain-containing protein [Bacteroidota bacterium]